MSKFSNKLLVRKFKNMLNIIDKKTKVVYNIRIYRRPHARLGVIKAVGTPEY